ncbi:MAG: sulfite exporter TauE/SafE family protein [Bacteroidota bacterium]
MGIFLRRESFRFSDWWPYLLPSVPLAWLGGQWKISDHGFFLLLGFTLMVASVLLWIRPSTTLHPVSGSGQGWKKAILSGGIGFLSGLVSIGGGIFLSPLMHLFNWDTPRRIAAMAGLFILVNSVSGLLGQFRNGLPPLELSFVLPLLAAVLVGGQAGSRIGAGWFNPLYIRRVTALVVMVAALLILKDHW